MPDFPTKLKVINSIVISPQAPECIGVACAMDTSPTSAAWPSANRAIFVPFNVYHTLTIVQMLVFNGATASGNIDVGLYDLGGARLVSIGSTAQAGTSAYQAFDITDTTLNPGQYYMGVALDNATGTLNRWSANAAEWRGLGLQQMASAFPLPATATFALVASAYLPWVMASRRTVT